MGSSGSLCALCCVCGGAPRCAHDCGFPDCSKHAHPQGSNARTTSLRLARWRFAFISASTTVWQSCGSFEPPRCQPECHTLSSTSTHSFVGEIRA